MARGLAWEAARLYRASYEEALQDASEGLLLAWARCRDPTTFVAYARKCMRGQILRGIRDRSRKRWYVENGETAPVEVPLEAHHILSEVDPVEEALRTELWGFVDSLGPRDALVTRLYYQRELTQAEIASLVGVSQMQVSRILTKTRARLAEFYGVTLACAEDEEPPSDLGRLPETVSLTLQEYAERFFSPER